MSFLKVGSTGNNGKGKGDGKAKVKYVPITPGQYEAVIEKAEATESKSGNAMIKLQVVLRDDVDQEFKNRKLWDYVTDTPNSKWRFDQIAKAIAIPNGIVIETLQDFADIIQGQPVNVTIKQAPGPYGKAVDRITYYSQTQA
jgi:hypothetical protein